MNFNISKEMRRYNYLIGELEAAYHEMSLKLHISDSAMKIIYTICDQGEKDRCLLQKICRLSGLSKQTANSSIRKLESEGIVYLEHVGGKNKNVCLTEKGKVFAEHTALKMIEAENDILTSWPEEDVMKYLELTERFLAGLKKKTEELREETS
ncbi:MAG: winged helix-turn-helix transcriptional regulator [Lachnospiraceae bacterium]|nr:winged helix-turn-helix transcriptional regulator [Lachnospiraceae bacterium]